MQHWTPSHSIPPTPFLHTHTHRTHTCARAPCRPQEAVTTVLTCCCSITLTPLPSALWTPHVCCTSTTLLVQTSLATYCLPLMVWCDPPTCYLSCSLSFFYPLSPPPHYSPPLSPPLTPSSSLLTLLSSPSPLLPSPSSSHPSPHSSPPTPLLTPLPHSGTPMAELHSTLPQPVDMCPLWEHSSRQGETPPFLTSLASLPSTGQRTMVSSWKGRKCLSKEYSGTSL